MPPRHYPMAPPSAQQSSPSGSYLPPPPEHWQHAPAPAPPAHPHPPYENFPRTTALVPASIDTRGGNITTAEADRARQGTISEIVKHCNVLYQFAARYAGVPPHVQPSPSEIHEMTQRASTVVRLLEELKRLSIPDQVPKELPASNGASDEHRPPKRPWEDSSRDEAGGGSSGGHRQEYSDEQKAQTTAEQDMEIIRSKRATSAAGNAPGQPKSKYRKRSRATPPGKCHSCNIRETPEWRRGPDGARTLCNACGLHYAKLMRKRDKASAMGLDGKTNTITIESLRASTASARGADPSDPSPQAGPSHQQNSPINHPSGPTSPYEGTPSKQLPPASMHPSHHPSHGHPGPYQLMPVSGSGAPPPGQHHQMMPPPHSPSEGGMHPLPPWMAPGSSASSSRGYGGDHQSYMRTAHPPSHTRASPQ
ncbi:hypothetical protein NLI96_g12301 [Meripilus lineatus]|uniref:GATA-type domain-containing protein n=1 Tax=Meripilus lineatus TaxID=2056292 RepID=A0AAD5UQ49_9APHY|nr:hypothetical protein NLI96_g12301 [Physisporinus lineatus]